MGKRLESFPGETRPAQQKYPWPEWTDGSVWEIRRGVDYDVATENMRVNLHMKADALLKKVRTQKVSGVGGEGLVFQFTDSEEAKLMQAAAAEDPGNVSGAIELLYADALEIYERARAEVLIPRKDGTMQHYAANRYKQQIDKGYAEGTLVPTIAKIIRKPTTGFSHLTNADREDLLLENLVLDASKPYHRFFTKLTVEMAQQRMDDYRRGSN